MKLRKIAAGATLALAGLTTSGLMAGPAAADPINAKKGEVFTLVCHNLGTIEVATNGNGTWTPVHLTDHRVLVPYAFHIESTPTGGATQVVDVAKHAPKNATLDVCTFAGSEPRGTFSGIAYVAVH